MRATASSFAVYLDRLIATVSEDAEALGCEPEVEIARGIAAAGTSADRQLAVFAEMQPRGVDKEEALAAVVDWIAKATVSQTQDT